MAYRWAVMHWRRTPALKTKRECESRKTPCTSRMFHSPSAGGKLRTDTLLNMGCTCFEM